MARNDPLSHFSSQLKGTTTPSRRAARLAGGANLCPAPLCSQTPFPSLALGYIFPPHPQSCLLGQIRDDRSLEMHGGGSGGLGGSGEVWGGLGTAAPGAEPAPPACSLLLSACCLHFSCLFPSPYPVSFWPANFNLKLDWADLMQIPPGKTLKLMNSYVKSILHHREKVTSARKKNNKVKETRAFHV